LPGGRQEKGGNLWGRARLSGSRSAYSWIAFFQRQAVSGCSVISPTFLEFELPLLLGGPVSEWQTARRPIKIWLEQYNKHVRDASCSARREEPQHSDRAGLRLGRGGPGGPGRRTTERPPCHGAAACAWRRLSHWFKIRTSIESTAKSI